MRLKSGFEKTDRVRVQDDPRLSRERSARDVSDALGRLHARFDEIGAQQGQWLAQVGAAAQAQAYVGDLIDKIKRVHGLLYSYILTSERDVRVHCTRKKYVDLWLCNKRITKSFYRRVSSA